MNISMSSFSEGKTVFLYCNKVELEFVLDFARSQGEVAHETVDETTTWFQNGKPIARRVERKPKPQWVCLNF